jgi:hypothetical protein
MRLVKPENVDTVWSSWRGDARSAFGWVARAHKLQDFFIFSSLD